MQNHNAQFNSDFKKRLYQWTLRLTSFIGTLPQDSAYGRIGQELLRNATRVLDHYVKANFPFSAEDSANCLSEALKSANDSKMWLALLEDTRRGDEIELAWLQKELAEIAKVLASSLLTIKEKK